MGRSSEHHEATDGLVKLLTKANHDLTLVQNRLEREFQQIYPDNVSTKILNLPIFLFSQFLFFPNL